MGAFKLNYRDYFYCTKKCNKANHLGNVLTLFTDKKIPVGTGNTVSYYKADLVSSMDYSPFGAPLKGRTFNGSGSRYGFNGKENDNEVKGAGNQQDYGFRIYDTRLGRFLSKDPLSASYPFYTPYQFAGNSPILNFDLDGLEEANANIYKLPTKTTFLKQCNYNYGFAAASSAQQASNQGSKIGTLKYYFNPEATGSNGQKGAYMWVRESKPNKFGAEDEEKPKGGDDDEKKPIVTTELFGGTSGNVNEVGGGIDKLLTGVTGIIDDKLAKLKDNQTLKSIDVDISGLNKKQTEKVDGLKKTLEETYNIEVNIKIKAEKNEAVNVSGKIETM